MTVIETMDQLREVPVGTQVTVGGAGGSTWERVQDGFSSGGIVLPESTFAGDVSNRRVTQGAAVSSGQVWDDRVNGWLVLALAETNPTSYPDENPNSWWCLRFNRNSHRFGGLVTYRQGRLAERTLVSDPPQYAATARAIGETLLSTHRQLRSTQRATQTVTERVDTAERQVREAERARLAAVSESEVAMQNRLSEALLPLAERLAENDAEGRAMLVSIMSENGLRTPRATVSLTALLSGQTARTVADALPSLLPEGVAFDAQGQQSFGTQRAYVAWNLELRGFETEAPEGACVCTTNRDQALGTVTYDNLMRRLRDEYPDLHTGLYSVHWTIRCGNHEEDGEAAELREAAAASEKPKPEEQPF